MKSQWLFTVRSALAHAVFADYFGETYAFLDDVTHIWMPRDVADGSRRVYRSMCSVVHLCNPLHFRNISHMILRQSCHTLLDAT